MKVRISKIEEWDFDLKKTKEESGASFRELGEHIGLHWSYLNKIANGLICDEETANLIITRMSEPRFKANK